MGTVRRAPTIEPRHFMKKISLILILFASPLRAETLTLTQVLGAVRTTHPSIEVARQTAESARHRVHAESWLPDLEAEVMMENIPFASSGLKNADMTKYSVSQEIPFPGTLKAKADALKREFYAKESLVTSTERQRVYEAKTAFYQLVATRNELHDKSSILSYYRQAVDNLTKVYASGSAMNQTATPQQSMGAPVLPMPSGGLDDVLMIKMRQSELTAEIHDLNHQAEALIAKINLMMGRDPETPITSLTSPPLKTLKTSAKVLEEKLFAQNSDLSALMWMAKKSEKDVTVARQGFVPTIAPEVEYDKLYGRANTYTLGIKFNVPLWANRNAAEISMTKADAYRAKAEYESGKLDAKTELYNLVAHAKRHYEILQTYRNSILPLARTIVNTAVTAQATNLANATATGLKLTDYYQASSMYWQMWTDYQMEFALLEQLVGEDL